MTLYLIIIGVGCALTLITNLIICFASQSFSLAFAILSVPAELAALLLIDAIAALFTRYGIKESFFTNENKLFKIEKSNSFFYNLIRIRSWKDKVPETGKQLAGFSKKHVADKNDPKYVLKFISETCYAEFMHFLSAPLSYLTVIPFALFFPVCSVYVPLFMGSVNFVLQIMPALVQRYNRPKLVALYRRKTRNGA